MTTSDRPAPQSQQSAWNLILSVIGSSITLAGIVVTIYVLLRTDISNLNTDISSLDTKINTNINRVADKVVNTIDRVAKLEGTISGLTSAGARFEGTISGLTSTGAVDHIPEALELEPPRFAGQVRAVPTSAEVGDG